eukprot:gene13916-14033_t
MFGKESGGFMVIRNLLKAFGLVSDPNQRLIDQLHAQIVIAARQPEFYIAYGVRDDFDGRFELFCLLCSLVLQRLNQLPAPGTAVAQDLTDAVIRHLEIILRQEGIGDVAVPKRIKKYAMSFSGRSAAYLSARASGDNLLLCESLTRNFNPGAPVASLNHFAVERMLRYVETTEAALATQDLGVFTDGQVPFPEAAQDNFTPVETQKAAPFVHIFHADSLRERATRVVLTANPVQAAALADLNGLVAVNELTATFDIARSGRNGVKLTGEIAARVTQTCSITLEPFEADVQEKFELKYVPTSSSPSEARHRKTDYMKEAQSRKDLQERVVEHSMTEEDPPEEMIDGKIDLGALVTEFFALGIDPYPRKPGADLVAIARNIPNLEVDAPTGVEEKISPFSSLAKLK